MNIVLFGPPGAGKGTQAENLVKEFNFFKASTGDLLRKEIKKKSSLGTKIKSIIEQGLLVSDDIINDLIENILYNNNYFNRIIFDGYPRNLNQAKHLDVLIKKYNQKTNAELILLVPVIINIFIEIWPVRSSGSFFTTWGATFFWLNVGIFLSAQSLFKTENTNYG